MVDVVAVDVESANVFPVVDACGLGAVDRLRNRDHFEDAAEFVVNVRGVGRSVVCAHAVVAGSLSAVVDAKQLVEGGSGIVNGEESAVGIAEKRRPEKPAASIFA